MSQSITWQVKGANWQEPIQSPTSSCPLEVATRAIEKVWSQESSTGESPAVGFIMEISHEKMKSAGEHIMVLSALVLANAGFHEESADLNRSWAEQKNL